MEPYQQRVIEEKADLDKRAKVLSEFIGLSKEFETIDDGEQERLREQCETMWEYSEILGKRIAAFPKAIGDQKDITILINHGIGEYDIEFIQQIEGAISDALSPLGFAKSTTAKGDNQCEINYYQFGWTTK